MSAPMRGLWRLKQLAWKWRERRNRARARRAVAAFPRIADKRPHGLAGEVIVSLTSYPARFATLALTLRSLLDQTVAADRTVLWTAHGDAAMLPADVRTLEHHGLEIRTCEDIRSYKKLIPALREWPDAIHITADDDLYYPRGWLADLVSGARREPNSIIGRRVHLALLDAEGMPLPYLRWIHASERFVDDLPRGMLFPTGSGGILYPARSLVPQVGDEAAFTSLCPTGDDIWFFWMAKLAGTEHRGLGNIAPLIEWAPTAEGGLVHGNVTDGGNDRQIAAMIARFGTPWLKGPPERRSKTSATL